MLREVSIVLAGMCALAGLLHSRQAVAQACTSTADDRARQVGSARCVPLLPPRVDHVPTVATLLHWGISAVDVVQVMGAPEQVDTVKHEDSTTQILRYPAKPIATTVTLVDGKLSGVALDVARFDQPGLPAFIGPVFFGLNRAVVLQLVGAPAEDLSHEEYGMVLEQMIFARSATPDASVFFINGWAVRKEIGRDIPRDIFALPLPTPPRTKEEAIDACDDGWAKGDGQVRLGTSEDDVQALYGAPKLHVHYTFKGYPADYAIYETVPGRSFARFTFIDGVLTEFADDGKTPLNEILNAR